MSEETILQMVEAGTPPGYEDARSCSDAATASLQGFFESVAKEVEPFGIRFTLVEPGPTVGRHGRRPIGGGRRPPIFASMPAAKTYSTLGWSQSFADAERGTSKQPR
jgi:NAD(P)-dependent dehydrogenase (short-subunit alcohol dehydrogenase family)